MNKNPISLLRKLNCNMQSVCSMIPKEIIDIIELYLDKKEVLRNDVFDILFKEFKIMCVQEYNNNYPKVEMIGNMEFKRKCSGLHISSSICLHNISYNYSIETFTFPNLDTFCIYGLLENSLIDNNNISISNKVQSNHCYFCNCKIYPRNRTSISIHCFDIIISLCHRCYRVLNKDLCEFLKKEILKIEYETMSKNLNSFIEDWY